MANFTFRISHTHCTYHMLGRDHSDGVCRFATEWSRMAKLPPPPAHTHTRARARSTHAASSRNNSKLGSFLLLMLTCCCCCRVLLVLFFLMTSSGAIWLGTSCPGACTARRQRAVFCCTGREQHCSRRVSAGAGAEQARMIEQICIIWFHYSFP